MLSLLKALSFLLGHLPLVFVRVSGKVLGRVAYLAAARHRKTALANLDLAFRHTMTQDEKERIVKKVFENLSVMFLEFTRIPWLSKEKLEGFVEFSGLENFDRALKKGRGVILCTAHFGNWELLAASLACRGYRLDIVAREIDNPVFEEFVTWVRTRSGNLVCGKHKAMRKLLRGLSNNSIVGILLDQNVTGREGYFIDFFGVPACTNKGPALLAESSGAAVVPAFIRRHGNGHRVEVGPEIEMIDTGDRERDAQENTRRCTKTIEEMIRRYPDQWFWVHRRWKTRPPQVKG